MTNKFFTFGIIILLVSCKSKYFRFVSENKLVKSTNKTKLLRSKRSIEIIINDSLKKRIKPSRRNLVFLNDSTKQLDVFLFDKDLNYFHYTTDSNLNVISEKGRFIVW